MIIQYASKLKQQIEFLSGIILGGGMSFLPHNLKKWSHAIFSVVAFI